MAVAAADLPSPSRAQRRRSSCAPLGERPPTASMQVAAGPPGPRPAERRQQQGGVRARAARFPQPGTRPARSSLRQGDRAALPRRAHRRRPGAIVDQPAAVRHSRPGPGSRRQPPGRPTTGERHRQGQGRQVGRHADGQLADADPGPGAAGCAGHHHPQGRARPGHPGRAARLRPAPQRAGRAHVRPPAAARRPLGDRRHRRQRQPRTHGADARLDQGADRPLGAAGRPRRRAVCFARCAAATT